MICWNKIYIEKRYELPTNMRHGDDLSFYTLQLSKCSYFMRYVIINKFKGFLPLNLLIKYLIHHGDM